MLNISVNLQNTKSLDHIFKSSLDFQSFFNGLYVIYQLSEIKDDIHVVFLFPCLLGHPVHEQKRQHPDTAN